MAEELPASQAGARFTRLMTTAKKSKMHHMFVLAGTICMLVLFLPPVTRHLPLYHSLFEGPYGSSILNALMDSCGEAQRLTYMRIFQACGELWAKELRVDSLPDLQRRAVEAVCLAELHLPASEADIKMHDLIHLAYQNIPYWGKWLGGGDRMMQHI